MAWLRDCENFLKIRLFVFTQPMKVTETHRHRMTAKAVLYAIASRGIKCFFGTLGSLLVIFGTFGTVFTFGTPVAFGTLRIGSVFSTLRIIPSEFLYIGGTFVIAQSTAET